MAVARNERFAIFLALASGALAGCSLIVTFDPSKLDGGGRMDGGGDGGTDGGTDGGPPMCAQNQHVESMTCVACATGTTRPAGDDPTGADTECTTCAQDFHVMGTACVSCPAGTTRPAGDTIPGGDTSCTAILCAVDERVVANACA